MGATSVTGVGLGSAEGKDAGRKEYTVSANRLIGPRVVAADVKTLSTGSGVIVLPKLSGDVTDYIAIATDKTAAAAVKAVLTFNDHDTTLTLTGTSSDVIQWMIVKVGLMP